MCNFRACVRILCSVTYTRADVHVHGIYMEGTAVLLVHRTMDQVHSSNSCVVKQKM